jgi:Fic family protein
MEIEAEKVLIDQAHFSPAIEAELRRQARIRSSHFSTRIEGNKLTLDEAVEVIEHRTSIKGKERDVNEVRNYWDAIVKVEEWAAARRELTEDLIQRMHSIIYKGIRHKPTEYRDGQNVIRDAGTGRIVYLPPEAKDVPGLMHDLVKWGRGAEKAGVPVPIIAGLLHYQFETIHPYYDGNGRTGRLLATFVLQRDGYGLQGFFSLEEHHARNLEEYYKRLAANQKHNYNEGREKAELTPWLEYFVTLLAEVFKEVGKTVRNRALSAPKAVPLELRTLKRRERAVLGILAQKETITSRDVADALGLSVRMARNLLERWVTGGFLEVADPSNKNRAYKIKAKYRKYIGD